MSAGVYRWIVVASIIVAPSIVNADADSQKNHRRVNYCNDVYSPTQKGFIEKQVWKIVKSTLDRAKKANAGLYNYLRGAAASEVFGDLKCEIDGESRAVVVSINYPTASNSWFSVIILINGERLNQTSAEYVKIIK